MLRYFKIREVKLEDDSDIKVPWELSRFYHFSDLGRAYYLTVDELYALEFRNQVQDWIEDNPPYYGVNWNCPMEVAIRSVNWIWGFFLLRDSPHMDKEFQLLLAKNLYLHGDYLINNLEFDKKLVAGKYIRLNGNHYIANLIGLIYLGMCLEGREPDKWLDYAVEELFCEISQEILRDGVHWELSPSYHRLVLEMILSAFILLRDTGRSIPPGIEEKVLLMLHYVEEYSKPDGSVPLVRDADNGRLHVLSEFYFNDHRHVIATGGVFFKNDRLISAADKLPEDVFWLLGDEGCKRWQEGKTSLSHKRGESWTLAKFPEAGYYILQRKRGDGDLYLFISCANVGMGGVYGGHAHCDVLSFELYWGKGTMVTDSGTFVYSADPPMRNSFRSTSAHNTVRIDGEEINRFDQRHLFNMENDANPQVLECNHGEDFFQLKARHFGYSRLASPVVHTRTFRLDKMRNTLTIEDELTGEGVHQVEAFFHFSPGTKVECIKPGEFSLFLEGYKAYLRIEECAGLRCSLEEGWFSPSYGLRERNVVLVLQGWETLDLSLKAVFTFKEKDLYS
jgi:hypothetical protein